MIGKLTEILRSDIYFYNPRISSFYQNFIKKYHNRLNVKIELNELA